VRIEKGGAGGRRLEVAHGESGEKLLNFTYSLLRCLQNQATMFEQPSKELHWTISLWHFAKSWT
jgi:hypothetical protein